MLNLTDYELQQKYILEIHLLKSVTISFTIFIILLSLMMWGSSYGLGTVTKGSNWKK